MANDYLSLLQAALVNSQKKSAQPKSVQFQQGMVAGKYTQPEINYSALAGTNPVGTSEDDGFQLGDLNPLPALGDAGMRAIDILSRGNYATMNMLQEGVRDVREGDPTLQDGEELGFVNFLKAMGAGFDEGGQAWQGLSGQQKITGANVVEDAIGDEADQRNGFGKGVAALSLDIFGDPTSYIGVGLVKSLLKGGKEVAEEGVEAATKAIGKTDEELAQTSAERLANWTDIKTANTPNPQAVLFGKREKGIRTKTPSLAPKATSDIVDETPVVGVEQLDLFAQPAAVKPATIAPKPKAPSVKFGPARTAPVADEVTETVTDAVPPNFVAPPKMIEQVKNYNLPVPTGRALTAPGEEIYAKGTEAVFTPTLTARSLADKVVEEGKTYVETARRSVGVEDLKAKYKSGDIRPAIDTPAEREFLHQLNRANKIEVEEGGRAIERGATYGLQKFNHLRAEDRALLTQPGAYSDGARPMPKKADYAGDPDAYEDALRTWRSERVSFANPEVTVRIDGKAANITSDQLWKALNGEDIPISHKGTSDKFGEGTGARVIKPEQVQVYTDLGKGGKKGWVPASAIAKQTDETLNSKKYWDESAKVASARAKNPEKVAKNIARAELDVIWGETKRAKESLDKWLQQAKINHPELSEATLRQAYKAGQELLTKLWSRAKVNPEQFIAHQRVVNDVQNAMTSAVLRHATPEELMTDIAIQNQKIMNADAKQLLDIAKSSAGENPAYAAKVAQQADTIVKEADEAVVAAEKAEDVAKAERVVEAKGNATAVRVAKVTNDVDAEVEKIIGFAPGSKQWVDAGVGMVRSITKMTLENIGGARQGKRFPAYNQMKQTKTILAAKEAIARYSRGKKMSPEMKMARAVQVVRATEHQLAALGHNPTVWNMVKGQGRKNIDFSAAELLDDMLKVSPELAMKALSEPNFNHVLQAALLKNKKSLDAITDDGLREFLQKYDAASNTARTADIANAARSSAITSGIKQTDVAMKKSAVIDSPARQAAKAAESGKQVKAAIRDNPGAPVEVSDAAAIGAKKAADDVIETVTPQTKVARATQSQKNALVSESKVKSNKASQNVQRAAGATPAKPAEIIDEVEFDKTFMRSFGEKFANHVGASTAYPMMQDAFGYVLAYISDSSRWWKELTQRYDEADTLLAVRSMRPGIEPPVDGPAAQVYEVIRGRVESILGGSGIEKYVRGNTTATRAGIDMDTLNKWVRQKAVKKADGKIFQFGGKLDDGTELKGLDWLKQWEYELSKFDNADAAIHFLHNMEAAMYSATTERILFDDFVVRFGLKDGGYSVAHPYFAGAKFSKEHALEMKRVVELIESLQYPKPSGKFWSTYDQLLRLWKTGVTIYNPVHHIRNFAGDSFLMLGDGGKPRHFAKSAQLLRDFREAKFDPDAVFPGRAPRGMSLSNAGDIERLRNSLLQAPTAGQKTVKVKGTDIAFSDDQIVDAAYSTGMFQTAGNVEDIMEAGANFVSDIGNKFPRLSAPLGGRGHKVATRAAENREHLVRMAHFVHAVESSGVKRLKGMSEAQYRRLVIEDAARRVRKYHPDGLDMTAFERKYMRRAIPFYSWQRKSVPLILAISVQKPGLVTAYPKAQYAVSYGTGNVDPNNPNEMNRMLPGGELLPDFITGSPYAVVGNSEEGGVRVASGPSTPAIDFFDQLNNPGGSAMGMLTPFATVPASLAYGKDPRTGVPIEGIGDQAKYLGGSIPGVSTATRWGTNKQPANVDFMNWLLGTGALDTKGYEKVAQFDARERAQREAG